MTRRRRERMIESGIATALNIAYLLIVTIFYSKQAQWYATLLCPTEYLEPKNCLHKKQERMRRQAVDIGDCGRINYEKPSTDPFQDLERILGGKESIPNNYPWMVLLLKQSPGGQ